MSVECAQLRRLLDVYNEREQDFDMHPEQYHWVDLALFQRKRRALEKKLARLSGRREGDAMLESDIKSPILGSIGQHE